MNTKALALFAALSTNSGGQDRQKIIESFLGENDSLNSKQKLVLEYLQQADQNSSDEDLYADEFDDIARLEQKGASDEREAVRHQAKENVRRKLVEMQVELNELRQRNEVFAHTLGACPCWGYDPSCIECNGQGVPGYYVVDRKLFDQFVAPVLPSLYGAGAVYTKPVREQNIRQSQAENRIAKGDIK